MSQQTRRGRGGRGRGGSGRGGLRHSPYPQGAPYPPSHGHYDDSEELDIDYDEILQQDAIASAAKQALEEVADKVRGHEAAVINTAEQFFQDGQMPGDPVELLARLYVVAKTLFEKSKVNAPLPPSPPSPPSSADERLDALETKIDAIGQAIAKLEPKPRKTYAEALAVKVVPAVKEREITVHPLKEGGPPKGATNREVVEMVNRKVGERAAVAARKLPSGDWTVIFKTVNDKKHAEQNKEWPREVFGTGAQAKSKSWTVVTGSLATAVATQMASRPNWDKQIERENDVRVVRASLSRKARKRTHTPLYIAVATVTDADKLCRDGIVLDGTWLQCTPFCEGARLRQCYKCYQYGHVARLCRSEAVCGWCAETTHSEDRCPQRREEQPKYKCAVCRGLHVSWSKECKVRADNAAKVRVAWATRPARFATTDGIYGAPGEGAIRSPGKAQPTKGSNPPKSVDDSPAGGRGRPKGATKAAKGTRRIDEIFQHARPAENTTTVTVDGEDVVMGATSSEAGG